LTKNITVQRTKFDYVVASLAPEFTTEVRDLILQPPDATSYDRLKEQLIKCTDTLEQRRLQQLFNAEKLCDKKPTQLLRRMQQLLGEKATNTDAAFMREIFLQRLPPNVRMVLASTPDTGNIEDLAQLANKVVEVAVPAVASINTSTELQQLRQEVADLKGMLQSLKLTRRPSRSCGSSPAPPPQLQQSQELCWYHAKFGEQAQKCKPPCSKSGNLKAKR